MDFRGLLERVKGAFTNPVNQPSVIGNVTSGQPWNAGLPRYGGEINENRMIQNPNIVSPLQAPDELTPGLEREAQLEQQRPRAVLGAQTPEVPPVLPEPTPDIEPEPTPTPTTFEQLVTDVMSRNQIPAPVGLGIAQAEGGRIGSNNPFNINAVDSNPDAAFDYPTPEAGVQAFADLITKNPRYAGALQHRDNPDQMIEAIQNAGYAGDPKTWKQRSMSTGGAGKNFDQWADFVRSTKGYGRYQ